MTIKSLLKIALLSTILAVVFSLSFYTASIFTHQLTKPKTALPIPTENPYKPQTSVSVNNRVFDIYYRQIKDSETLDLILNLPISSSSATLMKTHNCIFGSNGSFYTTQNQPLGLFYYQGKIVSPLISSPTFNGLLGKTNNNSFEILAMPDFLLDSLLTKYDFLIQSGPLFQLENKTAYEFIDNNSARRILVAQTKSRVLFLFAVTTNHDLSSGPTLGEIPLIFSHSQIKSVGEFSQVLNMDGGMASVFFDEENFLSEVKPIGSLLCGVKKNQN